MKRSSRFSKTARSLVFIAGWVLFGFVRSISASELCIRALHANSLQISPENSRYYRSVLDRTETFHDLDLTLREATNQRLKEKFRISNDLPIRASAYQKTRFGLSPQAAPSETRGRLILNVEFGYVVSDTFKPIGTLKSVKVSDSGEVLEVVAGSQELLDEFKAQIFGRRLSDEERNQLSEINLGLIEYLRTIPEFQAKVAQFAKSRGWPEGIADEAHLAYCDRSLERLSDWAARNHYSLKQLRDAGWLKLSFDREGRPRYSVWASGIRIPFFSDAKKSGVVGWRTRILEAPSPDYPKYLSELKDRAVESAVSLNEWFYGVWNITEPVDRLVITEGEFKSLIATKLAGVPTLGMLGITNYTPELLQELAKLPVKEFIIIFDRDADGKGLMRANGVTDSQRGAYQLAIDLKEAGAKTVKIGILPDAFGDERKVGIDDLILAKGPDPYRAVVERSMSPAAFANEMGLDSQFQEIHHRRQALRRALEQYENSLKRGGSSIESARVEAIRRQLKLLDEAYRTYLNRELKVQSLYDSSPRFDSLAPVSYVDGRGLGLRGQSKKRLSPADFKGRVLLMDFVSSGTSQELYEAQRAVEFPLTRREIKDGFYEKSLQNNEDYLAGMQIANAAGFKPRSLDDFASVLLAGFLSHTFPADEYFFEFNVDLKKTSEKSGQGSFEKVPVLIRKKDGSVVAMAQLHLPTPEKPARWLSRVKGVLRAR